MITYPLLSTEQILSDAGIEPTNFLAAQLGQRATAFDLLALATELDTDAAWELLTATRFALLNLDGDHKPFLRLYRAVAIELTWRDSFRTNEIAHFHPLFDRRLRYLIPGAKLMQRDPHPDHRPDRWVELHGQICPVEIKAHAFDNAAVLQLQRYNDPLRVPGRLRGGSVTVRHAQPRHGLCSSR